MQALPPWLRLASGARVKPPGDRKSQTGRAEGCVRRGLLPSPERNESLGSFSKRGLRLPRLCLQAGAGGGEGSWPGGGGRGFSGTRAPTFLEARDWRRLPARAVQGRMNQTFLGEVPPAQGRFSQT